MKRLIVSVTDEMDEALRELADDRRAPVSAIVREAIEEFFEHRGKNVVSRVQWGRTKAKEDSDSEAPTPEAVGRKVA